MIVADDIMSDHVVVIYDDMLISQVAHLMLRDRVSGFPVVSKEIGLCGIITMTDLFVLLNDAGPAREAEEFHTEIARIKNLKVKDVMSGNIVSITPQTTLDEITRLIVEKGKHTFPVMDNGKLVGIVSRHDILNAIYSL